MRARRASGHGAVGRFSGHSNPGGQRCVALIRLLEKRKPEEEWQQTAIQYSSDVRIPKAMCVPWIHQLPL